MHGIQTPNPGEVIGCLGVNPTDSPLNGVDHPLTPDLAGHVLRLHLGTDAQQVVFFGTCMKKRWTPKLGSKTRFMRVTFGFYMYGSKKTYIYESFRLEFAGEKMQKWKKIQKYSPKW